MEASPIVTDDEKRQLILAHAAVREQRRENWGLGYYGAIAASCLVIITGWMLTLGSGLRSQIPNESDSILKTLRLNWEKYDHALRASQQEVTEGMDTLSKSHQIPSSSQTSSTKELK